MGLNIVLVGVLVAVGMGAHSLGVLAEGADYLADAAAIGVSLFAIWLAGLLPTPARPHGYPKATAWAALVNGGWLLLLTLLVNAAAIDRLATGTRQVHGLPVLIVSSIAALVMVIGALILGGDEEVEDDDHGGNLNIRAVLLDTVADAAAAAGVAITGAIISVTGDYYWLDATVALLVSVVIAYHAVKLLRRVTVTLRPTSPVEVLGWRVLRRFELVLAGTSHYRRTVLGSRSELCCRRSPAAAVPHTSTKIP